MSLPAYPAYPAYRQAGAGRVFGEITERQTKLRLTTPPNLALERFWFQRLRVEIMNSN